MLDSLSACHTHTLDDESRQRASSPVDWSPRPFVLTLFFTRRIKSYKGFLLHTLLANCIKAFGGCCLSRTVCTSIKSGEPPTRCNLCQISSLRQRATQEAGERERVTVAFVCAPPSHLIQPDRERTTSASPFPATVFDQMSSTTWLTRLWRVVFR